MNSSRSSGYPSKKASLQRGWWYYDFYPNLDQPQNKKSGYELVEISEKNGEIYYYGLYFLIKAFPKTWKSVIQEMEIRNFGSQGSKIEFIYQSKVYQGSGAKFSMSPVGYKNFCALTPDAQLAVFYQLNRGNELLTQEEKLSISSKMRAGGLSRTFGDSSMDINHDGQPDFFLAIARLSIQFALFSYQEGYKKLKYLKTKEATYDYLISSPGVTDYTCSGRGSFEGRYYRTDGPNLFLVGRSHDQVCNLTKLTTPKSKGE